MNAPPTQNGDPLLCFEPPPPSPPKSAVGKNGRKEAARGDFPGGIMGSQAAEGEGDEGKGKELGGSRGGGTERQMGVTS